MVLGSKRGVLGIVNLEVVGFKGWYLQKSLLRWDLLVLGSGCRGGEGLVDDRKAIFHPK